MPKLGRPNLLVASAPRPGRTFFSMPPTFRAHSLAMPTPLPVPITMRREPRTTLFRAATQRNPGMKRHFHGIAALTGLSARQTNRVAVRKKVGGR
jgi:hypothetical protein